MAYADILNKLKALADPAVLQTMARYGIRPAKPLGISIPRPREVAKLAGKNHRLALLLHDTDIHEARILAGFIDEPSEATAA